MDKESIELIKKYYPGPYSMVGGYIFDGENNPFLMVRGWGKLIGYHELSITDANQVQDSIGKAFVDLLNETIK